MPILKVDYSLVDNNLVDLKNLTNELEILNDFDVKPLKYANQELIKQLICKTSGDEEAKQSVDLINGNTDLIANQYEGGFKIWEGLHDIIDYLIECQILDKYSNQQNINFLELGCGSGLASIYCSQKLPKVNLHLQDFNADVIKYFTSVNVLLNSKANNNSEDNTNRFHYLYGDWSAIADDISADSGLKFDLILTSETLYNCDNYEKLCKVLKSSLAPNGTVYIASKSHYFGIGGGTYSFIEFIESDGYFTAEIAKEIETPLIRHIIKLCIKQ